MLSTQDQRSYRLGLSLVCFSILAGIGIIFVTEILGYAALAIAIAIPFMPSALFAASQGINKLRGLLQHVEWWHVLWFIFFASGLTWVMRDYQDILGDILDLSLLYRFLLVATVGIVLLFQLLQSDWIRNLLRGVLGLLLVFSLISITSTLWSVNPQLTLYKSMEYLIGISLLALILTKIDDTKQYKSLFDWTYFLVFLLALSGWIGIVLWPYEAIVRSLGIPGFRISGVYPKIGPVGLGDLGAILALVSASRIMRNCPNRNVYVVLFVFGITTLLISYSRIPLLAFLVSLFVVAWLFKKVHKWVMFPGIIIAVLIIAIWGGDADLQEIEPYITRGQAQEGFQTLSHRLSKWEELIPVIREQPLIGHGAYAGSREYLATESALQGRYGEGVDNEWIEIAIGTGIMGLMVMLVVITRLWKWLLKGYKEFPLGTLSSSLTIESIGLLTYMLLRSLFVTKFFIGHPPLLFLLIVGFSEYLRRSVLAHRLSSHEK